MTAPAPCPDCGSAIPADSPAGQCPRCLLEAGLESGARAAPSAPPSPEEIGKHFPALEVLEVLGQGGMGIVYKARQRHLDRFVALKVLPPEIAREPDFAERFGREARTLARLQHPHIVDVHDFGESGGLYWLLMEYVDGPNLRQVIRDGHLDPRQALAVVPQVCDALQYAHDRGIVHRDIKPENVLLDRAGNVKIADFGLAKLLQREPVNVTLTRSGQLMGTVHYMAPEQMRAPDTVDHRADIYSLGVVFYEMLTGELPVGTFPPPSEKPGVDARLDGVVLRALERERDRRWQKASDVRSEVDTISRVAAPASGPVPVPATARTSPPPRLSTLALLGGLGPPMALVAGTAVLFAVGAQRADTWAAVLVTTGALLVVGTTSSVIALVRIARSQRALHGTGWAIAGVVLGPTLLLAIGVLSLLLTGSVEPPADAPPTGVPAPTAWGEGDRKDVPEAAPTPPLEGSPADRTGAVKVVGGPAHLSDVDRARIATEIEAFWASAVPVLENEPNPDVKLALATPSDRAWVAGLTSEERDDHRTWRRLGLPSLELYGESLVPYRLGWVALDDTGKRARVVMATADRKLSFPVLLAPSAAGSPKERWFAALGLVERVNKALRSEDRSGWLDHDWFGEDKDPAERVTGWPLLSPLGRQINAVRLQRAWRAVDEAHGSPLPITLPEGTRLSDYRVYHVALEPTGSKGTLVVSCRAATMAFPITRTPDGRDWEIVPDGTVRRGPAQPGDQDGMLDR